MAGEFLRRAAESKQARAVDARSSYVDQAFAGTYPALFEFMTCTQFDGKPRQTSTVTLVAEDGLFKAMLNDRENNQSLWVTAERHDEVFLVLESTLQAEPVRWRPNRSQGTYTRQPQTRR